MRPVDPLEPQPGDFVKVFSMIDEAMPNSLTNWEEGIVLTNDAQEIVLENGVILQHEYDAEFSSVYYVAEDEA